MKYMVWLNSEGYIVEAPSWEQAFDDAEEAALALGLTDFDLDVEEA